MHQLSTIILCVCAHCPDVLPIVEERLIDLGLGLEAVIDVGEDLLEHTEEEEEVLGGSVGVGEVDGDDDALDLLHYDGDKGTSVQKQRRSRPNPTKGLLSAWLTELQTVSEGEGNNSDLRTAPE